MNTTTAKAQLMIDVMTSTEAGRVTPVWAAIGPDSDIATISKSTNQKRRFVGGFQSAASRPQTGHCADAAECSDGRAAPFRSFGSVDSNAIVRSKYAARGPSHPGPRATKRRSLRFPMLNSARQHCTSPRRGRLVEWSDQRRGSVRLHFRSRRSCRRCACDASYDSVGNARH